MNEERCKCCKRMFFKNITASGKIEIVCPKCKKKIIHEIGKKVDDGRK